MPGSAGGIFRRLQWRAWKLNILLTEDEIKYIRAITRRTPENSKNVMDVPTAGIVTNVGRNVPNILPKSGQALLAPSGRGSMDCCDSGCGEIYCDRHIRASGYDVHTIWEELKYGASSRLAPSSTAITAIPAKNSVKYK